MRKSYRDLKELVLGRVASGEWPLGTRLPGEEDLARHFGCARTTVNRALRELAEEGYLERRRKWGTMVRALPERRAKFAIPVTRREVEQSGQSYGYRLLDRRHASGAGRLDVPDHLAGRPLLVLECLHTADGRPFQHERRWIDLTTLPHAADVDFADRGPNEWLAETVPFSEVEIGFSAVSGPPDVRAALGVADGAPLFLIERSTWLADEPVTHVRLHHTPGYKITTRY